MFLSNLRLALWSVLSLSAVAVYAADPWNGARIMPKSDQVVLRVGGECTGGAYQIEWPATVERIQGQWLWIVDRGGYRAGPVSGWVSKEEVQKLDESYDYYTRALQTGDAPWLHWLMGIYLENKRESKAAQEEYLECLKVSPGDPDSAVRMAAENAPQLFDAAVRWARLKGTTAKSADEAVNAAGLLHDLAEIARQSGIGRPQLLFDQAEVLRKAYLSAAAKERKKMSGIDEVIASAKAEKDPRSGEVHNLFNSADYFYQLMVSTDRAVPHADPNWWKGYLGRAELYLDRVTILEDEVRTLLSGTPSPPSPKAAKRPASHFSAAQTPVDLKLLDDLARRLQSPKPLLVARERAEAACVALAAAIQAIQVATGCFDEAIRRNPDLIEAYRDRGLADLLLAQTEGTLALLEDSDPNLGPWLKQFCLELAMPPDKLDRAIVDGRTNFNDAVERLRAAKAKQARVTAEKKAISDAASALAKRYVAQAGKRGDGDAHPGNKPETAQPATSLMTVRDRLQQLDGEAAAVFKTIAAKEGGEADAEIAVATAALDASYGTLNGSEHLKKAGQSASAACEKSNFAGAESLNLLAAVYAARCNFDRAEFYQKLAVIFATDETRPEMLLTLADYRNMLDLVEAKKSAKTIPSPGGKGGGAPVPDDNKED